MKIIPESQGFTPDSGSLYRAYMYSNTHSIGVTDSDKWVVFGKVTEIIKRENMKYKSETVISNSYKFQHREY